MSKRFMVVSALIFAVVLPSAEQSLAQGNKAPYPRMAPVEQYLMARNAEVALARSAAPDSVSRDAKVVVLTGHGYETAVQGKSGWVCIVARSWTLPFDDPQFWNPRVRLPLCQNPPAVRSNLPLLLKTTELALAELSRNQISERIKTAYDNKELPLPEPGSMCYMMSKQQNFGDKIGNADDSHLMFWFPQRDQMAWGAEGSDSPINVHQYSPQPITEFTISVSKWSDGTPVQVK